MSLGQTKLIYLVSKLLSIWMGAFTIPPAQLEPLYMLKTPREAKFAIVGLQLEELPLVGEAIVV
ncbi:MAG: hypothetical protein K940chlam2_01756 [Chlamydiae bacterium]|nr:hypothetical protein [Chlamydiota bacterium]